jgi:hypothetical protein
MLHIISRQEQGDSPFDITTWVVAIHHPEGVLLTDSSLYGTVEAEAEILSDVDRDFPHLGVGTAIHPADWPVGPGSTSPRINLTYYDPTL